MAGPQLGTPENWLMGLFFCLLCSVLTSVLPINDGLGETPANELSSQVKESSFFLLLQLRSCGFSNRAPKPFPASMLQLENSHHKSFFCT